jgi:glyoxylase-like metal-dependent hydrolase (beta-lactamase superfamily II)
MRVWQWSPWWLGVVLAAALVPGCPPGQVNYDPPAGDDDDSAGQPPGGDDDVTGDDDTTGDDPCDEDAPLEGPGPFAGLSEYGFGPFWITPLDGWTLAIRESDGYLEPLTYLLAGNCSALLVDTGVDSGDLSAAVASAYDGEVQVLLTHSLRDVTCGAHRFDRVALLDVPFAHGYLDEYHGGSCYDWAELVPFDVTDWIDDGHHFSLGGRAPVVIAAPGHTPDSVALWDETLGWLLTGPSAFDYGYSAVVDVAHGDSDFDAYRGSLDLLADLAEGAERTSGGRGNPDVDPGFVAAVRDGAHDIDAGLAIGYVYGPVTYYGFADPLGEFWLAVGNWLHDEPFVDGNLTVLDVSATVGETQTTYLVRFTNTGSEDVLGTFWIDVYVDHETIPDMGAIGEVYDASGGLAAGAIGEVELVVEDVPGNGGWNSWARVDTDGLIDETDEMDNDFGPLTVP